MKQSTNIAFLALALTALLFVSSADARKDRRAKNLDLFLSSDNYNDRQIYFRNLRGQKVCAIENIDSAGAYQCLVERINDAFDDMDRISLAIDSYYEFARRHRNISGSMGPYQRYSEHQGAVDEIIAYYRRADDNRISDLVNNMFSDEPPTRGQLFGPGSN